MSNHVALARLVVLAGTTLTHVSMVLAQSTVSYIGPNNGSWGTAANWSPAVVPVNNPPALFNVILPADKAVLFDLLGPTQLTGLSAAPGGQIVLDNGEQLQILGVNDFAGIITASGLGTGFIATSNFSVIKPNARFFANTGAQIAVKGLAYTSPNVGCGATIMSADGVGSLLDLSKLGSFSNTAEICSGSQTNSVIASNGGVIDLSSVTSVVGPGEDRLRFRIETGGTINLSGLQTTAGNTYYDPEVPVFSLASLAQAGPGGYSNFEVSTTNIFNLPSLAKLQDGALSIADGGTINAPKLTQFINADLTLTPARFLIAPPFVNINHSRLHVKAGASLVIAAPTFTTSNSCGTTICTADGTGSLLDFSSLTSFSNTAEACSGSQTNSVIASNGGVIDLSGVTSVAGPGEDRLRFRVDTDGTIDLSSLKATSGSVTFDPEVSVFSLPSLVQAGPGGYCIFEVSVFNKFELPELTKVQDGGLYLADGGTINAPKLMQFINADLTLTPIRFLNAPPFVNIDHSRLHVKEGATLVIAAPTFTTSNSCGTTICSADGAGSLLDFSSLTLFNNQAEACSGSQTNSVVASNGGAIDLSGVTSTSGPGEDRLRFRAESGGRIYFGNLTLASGRVLLDATTINSFLYFGDLSIKGGGEFVLSLVANAHIAGDYTFTPTNEAAITLGDGKVVLDGQGTQAEPQLIEVGGADLGKPTGAIPQNFQIGQFTVGTEAQKTVALLVDLVNNGNRGPAAEPELLYMQGFPAEDGLRILGGSTLYLGDIEAYAVINNQWTRLRDLIPGGQNCVAFDQGTICLGEPVACYPDCDQSGSLDIDDFICFQTLYALGEPAADCDASGGLDIDDFICFQTAYAIGC